MRRLRCIVFLCLILVGCQSKNNDFKQIETEFKNRGYEISFGDNATIITGEDDMILASITQKDSEITYMSYTTGEGVLIYENGDYKSLTASNEYYDMFLKLLEEINITEKELFSFCVWEYEQFKDSYE